MNEHNTFIKEKSFVSSRPPRAYNPFEPICAALLHPVLGQGDLGKIDALGIEGRHRTRVVVIIELFQLTAGQVMYLSELKKAGCPGQKKPAIIILIIIIMMIIIIIITIIIIYNNNNNKHRNNNKRSYSNITYNYSILYIYYSLSGIPGRTAVTLLFFPS
jgi:uncharacterized membrane protein